MKTTDDLDLRSDDLALRLSDWMAATAPTREPEGLVAGALSRTESVRQRPSFLARAGLREGRFSLPVLSPQARLVALAVLLLVAVGAAVAVGARLLAPPAPIELTSRTYVGVVQPAGRMTTPRAEPAAVRLLDGRVLIVGFGGEDPMAEVYDPSTGRSLPVTGGSDVGVLSLALLTDGRVLMIGWQSGPTEGTGRSVAQLFDPPTNAIHEVGPMVAQRLEPALAALADGRALVAGGAADETGRAQASAELFDPQTETFSPTGSMPAARYGDFATLLGDGRVLVTRGCYRDGCSDAGATDRQPVLYDPQTGTFARTGQMIDHAGRVAPARLPDGRVLFVGASVNTCGRDGIDPSAAEFFDPSTDTFVAAPPIPHKATTLTPLLDGRVLLTGNWSALGPPPGGCGGPPPIDCSMNQDAMGPPPSGCPQENTRTTHGWMGIYDPATGDTQLSTDPYTGDRGLDLEVDRRGYGTAVRLADGRVLLIGISSYSGDVAVDAVDVFE